MVEFPAGGRSNTVQVAVLALMGQDADNAAVDLAHKIGGKLPR
jgi:D-alanyl-D-alanine carboxypeptidase